MTDRRDVLTKADAAFNARDIDGVLAAMHPDVDGRTPGRAAVVRGHEQVRDYWIRQWAAIEPTVEPVGFWTDREGRTVMSVHQVVRDLHGRVVSDGMVAHVYLIEDGFIRVPSRRCVRA